jgi:phosphatidylglycerophosphatase C
MDRMSLFGRTLEAQRPDMGEADPQRQPPPAAAEAPFRPLVAFDFDGTLTWRDSFLGFLAWRAGARRYAAGLIRLAPAGIAYATHRDRGRAKAAAVREFLQGATRAELEADAQRFATERARSLLRPDAVRAWRRWQAEGARLVIVTASPALIVAPFGRGLGAERVIGTELDFDAAGRVTGALAGPNCRGAEKVRRLKAAYGDDVRLEAAYGDSDGDVAMLSIAGEAGMKVFSGKPEGARS